MNLNNDFGNMQSERLDAIENLLRALVIIECAQMGMKKESVKKIIGGDSNKITKVWKHLKLPKPKQS